MPGLLQEILGQAFEKWLIRSIKGVDGAGSTHSRDSSLLGLLVDDSNQGITNEVVAQLTFHNAGAKALIHQLSTSFLATLQVLSNALGGPRARLVVAAIHAELNKLCNGVLLVHARVILVFSKPRVCIVCAPPYIQGRKGAASLSLHQQWLGSSAPPALFIPRFFLACKDWTVKVETF